jgi:hypothetical protein
MSKCFDELSAIANLNYYGLNGMILIKEIILKKNQSQNC